MDTREQFDRYISQQERAGHIKSSTARTYTLTFGYYLGFLESRSVAYPDSTSADFFDYLQMPRVNRTCPWFKELPEGLSNRSGRLLQAVGRGFNRYIGLKDHPLSTERFLRAKQVDGYTLKIPEDIDQLASVWQSNCAESIRNLAMLHTAVHSGVRSSELCGLDRSDLLWENKLLRLRNAKGARAPEYRPFHDPYARMLVRLWLDEFRPLYANGTDRVFVGLRGSTPGDGITSDGWRAILRKWSLRAGFEKPISPHSTRRAFAYFYLTVKGWQPITVMKAGGWKSWAAFSRYCVAIGVQDFLKLAEEDQRQNGTKPVKH